MCQQSIYFTSFDHYNKPISYLLVYPNDIKHYLQKEIIIRSIRDYISLFDDNRKTIYLFYLMGKTPSDIAKLTQLTTQYILNSFSSIVNGFEQYILNINYNYKTDTKNIKKYIEYFKMNLSSDDKLTAKIFEEDMLTTKIMKHFIKISDIAVVI